jgi:signal transduction histidine kinase/DNA-binding response OmpR family regulator
LVRADPSISRAFVTDGAGIERYDYPHDETVIGASFAHRDWYRGASERQATYVSEIYQRAAIGQPYVVAIATPIRHDGETIGYLVGQYTLSDLRNRIADMTPSGSVSLSIMDQNGAVAVAADTSELSHATRDELLSMRRLGRSAPVSVTSRAGDGHTLVSVTMSPTSGWAAIAHQPMAAVFEPANQVLRPIPALFGVCYLLVAVMCGLGHRVLKQYGAALRQSERNLVLAKEAADESSRAKSAFLANMSHEIRTPLNGVIGMADLLKGTELSERQARYIEVVRSSAHSLNALVSDVLDLSKIEAGKLDLEAIPFNFPHTMEEAMVMLSQRAGQKGLETALFIDPAVPASVRGDPDRLRQVVINLVSNAIKFTETGSIVVRVVLDSAVDDCVMLRVTVTDTGIGIDGAKRDLLFQAFSQLDASTTRRFGGTGLGLAICRQLVELMGGEIDVQSEPGVGSTFWFTCRFVRGNGGVQRRRSDPRGLRILAVDDNEATRQVLREQLSSWGLEAETASGGDDGLAVLARAEQAGVPFRVAIVDKDMPGTDGLAFCLAVRANERLSDSVLMLLLSVDCTIEDDDIAELGFDGSITKPVRQSQLYDTIVRAIDRAENADKVDHDAPRERSHHDADEPRVRSARILLAEDNEINQVVAYEILTQAGYVCEMAANGAEAVEAAKARQFDLILMDCQMPEMDGYQATRAIREAEAKGELPGRRGYPIPIVALTANAMSGDKDLAIACGMSGYVAKPIDAARLISVIEAALCGNGPIRPAAREATT